jgi:hypothetical protein
MQECSHRMSQLLLAGILRSLLHYVFDAPVWQLLQGLIRESRAIEGNREGDLFKDLVLDQLSDLRGAP